LGVHFYLALISSLSQFDMKKSFPRSAVCIAVLTLNTLTAVTFQASAQSTPMLKEVVVTGNPLGATEIIAPTAKLAGDELTLRTKSTLGETLDSLPGVSSAA
jgi:iron complex outermembrane recepter protein